MPEDHETGPAPRQWGTSWLGLWGLCATAGYVAVYALLPWLGRPLEHSGHFVDRMAKSIVLGSFAGGTLLCLLLARTIGARGRELVARVPESATIMAMILPAFAV